MRRALLVTLACLLMVGCDGDQQPETVATPILKSLVYEAVQHGAQGVKFYVRSDGNGILQNIATGFVAKTVKEEGVDVQKTVERIEDRRHQLDVTPDDWTRLNEGATAKCRLREFEEPPVDHRQLAQERAYGMYNPQQASDRTLILTWSDGMSKKLVLPRDSQNLHVVQMFAIVEDMINIYESSPFERLNYDASWKPSGY